MASQPHAPVTSCSVDSVKNSCAATPSTGGGLRIKIRLGGPEGEAISARTREPPFANVNSLSPNSTSSSTSSSASSPLTSTQASDEETAARRHAAIPPALVVKEQLEPAFSFGSLSSKDVPPPNVKAPKL